MCLQPELRYVAGPVVWNSIPAAVREADTV